MLSSAYPAILVLPLFVYSVFSQSRYYGNKKPHRSGAIFEWRLFIRQPVMACCPLPAMRGILDAARCKSGGTGRHRQYGQGLAVLRPKQLNICKS